MSKARQRRRAHKRGRPGPAVKISVLKIDPVKRKIAMIRIKPSTSGVRSVLGMGTLRHHVVLDDVNGERLIAGMRVGLERDDKTPEWRVRGCSNYAGVGILFGTRNRSMEFPADVPVDLAWAEREIVWAGPGEDAPAKEVRERMSLPEPESEPGEAENG